MMNPSKLLSWAPTVVLALLIILALTCTTTTAAALSDEQRQSLFVGFINQYDKSYETTQVLKRLSVFNANLDKIMAHNADKTKTYTMALNQFADLTAEEFAAQVSRGLLHDLSTSEHKERYLDQQNQRLVQEMTSAADKKITQLHASPYISWLNASLPVRNQGSSCGSCVSASFTTSLSTLINVMYGKQQVLGYQQIVDCQTICLHCNGCLPFLAADYVSHMGVALEKDYPYTGKWDENTVCREWEVQPAPYTRGLKPVFVHGDAEIQAALQRGPVTALLAASSSAFQFYKDGVLSDCTDLAFNHAISIHGYQKDPNTGLEYYEVVNSWGSSWGKQGTINIVANSGGFKSCGLGLFFDTSVILPNH